ncbi:MAG: TatD family hydrolase [Muribaculaceae bacterium]|nr:TatD family hydrolase [Muribaculaceae bacterium]
MILNIHAHNPAPDPEAIIDISTLLRDADSFAIPDGYPPGQLFSAAIHPWWLTDNPDEALLARIETAVADPRVAIIGETGIDIPKGGPLFRQMNTFKKMIALSEKYRKPLLIHNVKAHEIIIGVYKELKPSQPWIIHGFRNKPAIAQMFLRQGFYISFGSLFNPATVRDMPADRILAETDESPLPINEIIFALSDARGTDLTHVIAENSARIIGLQDSSTPIL